MKRPAYDSPAVPINWSRLEYVSGENEGVQVKPDMMKHLDEFYKQNPEEAAKTFGENPYELRNILDHWVRHPQNSELQIIPTDSIVLKLDKEAIKRSGMLIPDSLNGEIPEYMHISLKGKRILYKSELMMLEMLANTNWERPIYMAITVGTENHLNLDKYFMQEGLAYRITPFNSDQTGVRVDSERMYDNLMNKYKYGGLQNPNIYLDETNLGMCRTHRRLFVILASQLVKEGKNEKALEVLEVIPTYNVPHDFILCSSKEMADDYIKIGHPEKALPILNELANKAVEYITWYESLDDQRFYDNYESCYRQLLMLDDVNKSLSEIALKEGDEKEGIGTRTAVHYAQTFNSLYEAFKQRIDDNK